jgi:hypothetical protein
MRLSTHVEMIFFLGVSSFPSSFYTTDPCFLRIKHGGPTLPAGGIQAILEESDALLLYDACSSAETAVTRQSPKERQSMTELISACGFQTTAPGVGKDSFTRTLMEELRLSAQGDPLSIVELFARILERPRNTPQWGNRTNPIYVPLTLGQDRRHILLESRLSEFRDRSTEWYPNLPDGHWVTTIALTTKSFPLSDMWKDWIAKAPVEALDIDLDRPLYEVKPAWRPRTITTQAAGPQFKVKKEEDVKIKIERLESNHLVKPNTPKRLRQTQCEP